MSSPTYRILAVDDLLDNLFLLQTILELEGYVVDIATSGTQALQHLHHQVPDLVLLDIMMPDMDGWQVTQQIRQNAKLAKLPILLLTAYVENGYTQQLSTVDANGLLRKPIDIDELLSNVEKMLPTQRESSLAT
jgi:CheY-like chemotaxis protein